MSFIYNFCLLHDVEEILDLNGTLLFIVGRQSPENAEAKVWR